MKKLLSVCFGTAGAYAGWTLWVWVAMALGWTPNTLVAASPAILLTTLLCGILAAALSRRTLDALPASGPGVTGVIPPCLPCYVGCAVCFLLAIVAWLGGGPQWLLWAMTLCALVPVLGDIGQVGDGPGRPVPATSANWPILALAATLIWGLHGLVAVSNGDDTHFLDAAAAFLVEADLSLFATDTLFQVATRPNPVYALNLGQSWDALAGYVSRLTGLDLLLVYHALLPAGLALLVPASWTLFSRLCGLRWAAAGLLIALVLILQVVYSDALAGSFLRLRLYQGKAAMMLVGFPLLISASLLHASARNARSAALLSLCLVATAGASVNGLYMGPMVAGMALLAFTPWQFAALGRTLAWLGLATLPSLVVVLAFHVRSDSVDMLDPDLPRRTVTVLEQFGWALSGRIRMGLYHAAAFAVCLLGLYRGQNVLARFGLVMLVLGLNPWLPAWLEDLVGLPYLYWRYYWMFPVGVLLTAAAAMAFEESADVRARIRDPRWRLAFTTTLAAVILATLPLSRAAKDLSRLAEGEHLHLRKVEAWAEPLARYFAEMRATQPGTPPLVLAPEDVARQVNYFPEAPRQLLLRHYYYSLVPGLDGTPEEARLDEIHALLKRRRLGDARVHRLLELSTHFGVTHLVFWSTQPRQPVDPRHTADMAGCSPIGPFLVCELERPALDPGST